MKLLMLIIVLLSLPGFAVANENKDKLLNLQMQQKLNPSVHHDLIGFGNFVQAGAQVDTYYIDGDAEGSAASVTVKVYAPVEHEELDDDGNPIPPPVKGHYASGGYVYFEVTQTSDAEVNEVPFLTFNAFAIYGEWVFPSSSGNMKLFGINRELFNRDGEEFENISANLFDITYKRLIHQGVIPKTSVPLFIHVSGRGELGTKNTSSLDRDDEFAPGGGFVNTEACAGAETKYRSLHFLVEACAEIERSIAGQRSFEEFSQKELSFKTKNSKSKRNWDTGVKFIDRQGDFLDYKSGSAFIRFNFSPN